MKKVSEMNRIELGAFVCSHLEKHGIEVTLTGGSCVSIYSNESYVTMDLDFIEKDSPKRRILAECLSEIGFSEEHRYFKHPETEFLIEFPRGPLAVGDEPITDVITIKTLTGTLRIISPTECVKDRLAAYFFWNDLQCLDQAILVAKHNKIDLKEVKRWSDKQGEVEKFEIFHSKL
ncbi:MAG: hypothetical protein K0B81_09210 [Candidatus Cloacimonetes bacterium]|nr:hypothetical protein [Candidatus Cloacimonadota bacterium]